MDWLNDHDLNTLKLIFNSKSDFIEKLFQDDSGQWMMYDGQYIYWFYGNYGRTDRMLTSYNATSGYIGYQKAKLAKVKERGPVPEGKYWVLLAPNPNRIAKADKVTGLLLANPDGGIERIPSHTVLIGGGYATYQPWGTVRARLFPDKSTNTLERSNFYLHDSHKGHSHGCIEVEKRLFDRLLQERNKFTKIALKVDYASPESITNGNTYRKD